MLRPSADLRNKARRHYNTKRPHSSLGYRPPNPEVIQWPASPPGTASPPTPAVAP
ncbi:integrase core domain-containing protein, partial [Accumulibacter sp.]|uniref:integrase core domain-containing protein n=1 Tax=Accumulibacter sp. TaxID=2053492 RepID=UPI0025BEA14D